MCKWDNLPGSLSKLLKNWDFTYADFVGLSRGLLTGWNPTLSLVNSYTICLGICIELTRKRLGQALSELNLSGSYGDKQTL